MMRKLAVSVALAGLLVAGGMAARGTGSGAASPGGGSAWASDPVWHDGLVEKATYRATKVIYGAPREYTAIVLTNKEQHDTRTWTKAASSRSTTEVFKHNWVEAVPTPNYPYHFVTTTHLTVAGMLLTAFQQSSQEYCGTSFRTVMADGRPGGKYELEAFSYMPEAGEKEADLSTTRGRRLLPEDGLPLALRDFPFESPGTTWALDLLPTQKTNRQAPTATVAATVRYAGREGDEHKLELVVGGQVRGTYHFADDRLRVMTRYAAADGSQTYELVGVERTDYWTIR